MENNTFKKYIPEVSKNHVVMENEHIVEKILLSDFRQNIFITGLSGNGKTQMVEQVCARNGLELFRVGITADTDEYVLIGRDRLINGETVWQDGVVVQAMKRGSVLLLDECDLATPRIMVIQSVLEGKSLYVGKNNEKVEPKKGFKIVATANTKGKGDLSGKFIGTTVLNEAFLDRFGITIEYKYPDSISEKNILKTFFENSGKHFSEADIERNEMYIESLVKWASNIRKLYFNDEIDEIISTRRLLDIITNYLIFENMDSAVDFCVNRFDDIIKDTFSRFWKEAFSEVSAIFEARQKELEDRKKYNITCSIAQDYDSVPQGGEVFRNESFYPEIDI